MYEFIPLSKPNPPYDAPVLSKTFVDRGFVLAEWGSHFLPGVTPEMLDWFWANMEKCYYLWAPGSHQSFKWAKSPAEVGFVKSVHKVIESTAPGEITLHRLDIDQFPFEEHLEHVIIESILNEKGEVFNLGVHMWEQAPGGSNHITAGATNTNSELPKFLIDFAKVERDSTESNHTEYEASQWPVFLPKLYDIWKGHPDPIQNIQCDLRVREKADGSIEYIAKNEAIKP
jgi:hypothetical protein